jgi:hypothetical protein
MTSMANPKILGGNSEKTFAIITNIIPNAKRNLYFQKYLLRYRKCFIKTDANVKFLGGK